MLRDDWQICEKTKKAWYFRSQKENLQMHFVTDFEQAFIYFKPLFTFPGK